MSSICTDISICIDSDPRSDSCLNSRALPARTEQTRAIMHQILNNLDPDVAQFPHELITYGGTGSVFQNWGQFRLVMKYLSEMTDEQTLVMYVVHSLISHTFTYNNATRTFTNINTRTPRSNTGTLVILWECSHTQRRPRVVVTNGLTVPNYSSNSDYERYYMLGVFSTDK